MRSLARALAAVCAGAVLAGCQTAAVQPEEASPVAAPNTTSNLAELHTRLGVGYMRERKYELAWQRLNRALEEDPNYSTAHNAMGLLYEQLGQTGKAERHLTRAVELNPGDSAAQTNLGSLLCRLGRYHEGETRFLQALKNSLYDRPEIAYANAGLCMKQGGDDAKAEGYFRSALQLDPRLPVALINMAEISYDLERYLQARGYLQRYLEVGRHSARTLWLGIRIERELGDKNAASSYAMLLKAQYPDSRETQLLLESGDL